MSDELRCPECAASVFPDAKHLAIQDAAGRWFHTPCARERLTRQDRGIVLSSEELATFAWGAVNYALGRSTYYPSTVVRVLARLVGFLAPGERAALLKQLCQAEERGSLGHECDAREWLMLKQLLEGAAAASEATAAE
jgi:hypothetical protein